MKILYTGFEPFGGEAVNPSWEAVSRLPDTIGGVSVSRLLLPVVFTRAAERLLDEVRRLRPDIVLMVGLAAGRKSVTPEKLAVNYRDARIPDNDGQVFHAVPVVPGGPDALMTRLSPEAMVDALREEGIPGSLSLSAGAYVCNDVFYSLRFREEELGCRCDFIHLPALQDLPLETDVKALTVCGETAVRGLTGKPL